MTLLERPFPLYRLDKGGIEGRSYFSGDKNTGFTFYTGVTTFISRKVPTDSDYWLNKWRSETDPNVINDKMRLSSTYGTFSHMCLEFLVTNGELDLSSNTLNSILHMALVKDETVEVHETKGWIDSVKKDMLAVNQWIMDKNFVALAAEIQLGVEGQYLNLAGTIDLVGYIDHNNKRMPVIVDYKTGRQSEDHVWQLMIYRDLWNYHFPDYKVDMCYNLHPKDWRKQPSYDFKPRKITEDHTKKMNHYLQAAAIDKESLMPGNSLEITGEKVEMGKATDYEVLTPEQQAERKLNQFEQEES